MFLISLFIIDIDLGEGNSQHGEVIVLSNSKNETENLSELKMNDTQQEENKLRFNFYVYS